MSTLNVESISHPTPGSLATINGTAPSNRNLIINGAMQVAQRGTSLTGITGADGYATVDRFKIININESSTNSSVWTMEQSSDAPDGFSDSLKLTATTADNDYGTGGSQTSISQHVESQNLQHLQYNTAGAKSFTVSFWVKSSVTGTYIMWFYNNSGVRQNSKTYTINTANTWEYKTVTISGDTGATLPNTNVRGIEVRWVLSTGSQYTSGTYMDGTWETFTTANAYAGHAVNVASATNNSWQITGVQLEVGSVATPFEHRSLTQEQQLCYRYYHTNVSFGLPNKGGGSYFEGVIATVVNTGTSQATMYRFPVPMRDTPTVTIWSPNNGAQGQAWSEITQTNVSYSISAYPKQLLAGTNPTGSGISGNVYYFHYAATAEL